MNIFYLDSDPYVCASLYGDKHVCKMIVETAQMLSTAWHVLSPETDNSHLYKPTHISHPCSLWIRENSANYQWAYELLKALCAEFYTRRSKRHATERLLAPLQEKPDLPFALEPTAPALAMPEELKCSDPVQSYRRYYRKKYQEGIVNYNWSAQRSAPEWIDAEI